MYGHVCGVTTCAKAGRETLVYLSVAWCSIDDQLMTCSGCILSVSLRDPWDQAREAKQKQKVL